MTTFSVSDARERLDEVLNAAERDGAARIRRGEGREFEVRPVGRSPLDVEGAGLDLTADEVVEAIREGRERG